jgi:putative phosphoribosyl transferase
MPFVDRSDAGRKLARRLEFLRGENVVVLGLPRGGVPVAFEVAQALGAPLDVIFVRKLGLPIQPELAMGAIGEDGVRIINDSVVAPAKVSAAELASVEETERAELERRARQFRGSRPRVSLTGVTAVVVDDGIATGSTARAACQIARAQGAARVVLAVPVAPPGAVADLGRDVEVVFVEAPRQLWSVGESYQDFTQTSDDEVARLLQNGVPQSSAPDPVIREEDIEVTAGHAHLGGHLAFPEPATAVVVFAHGSGSSRNSPRNRFVAGVLNRSGLGTLLFDLLTPDEERDRANVFDIDLMGGRLRDATRWLLDQPAAQALPVGYFGASTGAAAALWAAADPVSDVAAVVSRGGRPDLAGPRLGAVRAPTLLIVGEHDQSVLELNRTAQSQMHCESRIAVVPHATHLFEEPGALAAAAELARDWLLSHLATVTRSGL